MGRFFDAFRIDHVLGWFRIWEIPADCVKGNGRLGKFYPAMPIRFEWLEKKGIWDRKRLCEPWNEEKVVVGQLITKEDLDFLVKEELIKKQDDKLYLCKSEKDCDLDLQKKLKDQVIT